MSDEEKKYLIDILTSIVSIDEHLGEKKIFNEYLKNKTVRRAVEREFEIIGEATNRLLVLNPHIKLSYARTIVDLRNKVIHAYDAINHTVIWKIIIKDLPVLKSEVKALLDK
ncbi:MAG: hypothetical protein B6D61_06810 [Bacteroidetes bacterium 4484_249]|nr:MAG: hypothetical protein B6D61_06810 [Bacteroidetes bacterium 4484_249]